MNNNRDINFQSTERQKRILPEDAFGDWKWREALAESMVPLIGSLYRDGINLMIYGKSLVNESPVSIMKAHRFARQTDNNELSELETFPIIKYISTLKLSDCEIDILNEDNENDKNNLEIKNLKCEVINIKKVTRDIFIINLKLNDKNIFEFKAGQYAELYIGDCKEKHFSMANSPNTNELEFHIKTLDGGEVSNYVKNDLKLGEIITVKGPYGNAYLREKHKGPIIAVAGGTGLAPILSIIEYSQEIEMKQPINIYYGAQSEQELYFTEQLDMITKANNNLKFYPVTSEKSKNKTIRQGLVTDAVIEDINDFDGYKAYLAGPPKMVEAAEKILTNKGIRKVDIHSDAFYTPYDEIKE